MDEESEKEKNERIFQESFVAPIKCVRHHYGSHQAKRILCDNPTEHPNSAGIHTINSFCLTGYPQSTIGML